MPDYALVAGVPQIINTDGVAFLAVQNKGAVACEVKIELSLDGGATWAPFTTATLPANGLAREGVIKTLGANSMRISCPVTTTVAIDFSTDDNAPQFAFITRTAAVHAVYSGRCRVFEVRSNAGTGRVRVYNGSNADPLRHDVTPAGPVVLFGPSDKGVEYNLGLTVDNTGTNEVVVRWAPIL